MPRVSRAETERNRAAIEAASSKLIRERGLGVSVADVMGAAGLTHGGFYGHFRSKDALSATACQLAFADSEERWKRRIVEADGIKEARAAIINGYLSPRNRAAPGASCPIAALAVDVSREAAGKPVREAFNSGLENLIRLLASVQSSDGHSEEGRTDAIVELSTLVGALVLARATAGESMSDEFLESARKRLLSSP